MKKRVTIPALAALLLLQLPFSACEKPEYLDGPSDTTIVQGGEQATVYTRSYGWPGTSRTFQVTAPDLTWEVTDSVARVRIPGTLNVGDRLIIMLQLGIQNSGFCAQALNLEAGTIVGQNDNATPDDGPLLSEMWDQDEQTTQITRYQEVFVGAAMVDPYVLAYTKAWSGGCDGQTCIIMNCSLTVVVIPG